MTLEIVDAPALPTLKRRRLAEQRLTEVNAACLEALLRRGSDAQVSASLIRELTLGEGAA